MNDNSTGSQAGIDLLGYYDNEGIKLVRLSRSTKRCVDTDWQLKEVSLDDIVEWVRKGGDVGWQVGEDSGWIAAADMDWKEAKKLAPQFMLNTLLGAKGKESPSQYFYRSVGLGFKKFTGLDGSEIISLKASNNGRGHQVVVAPSVHREKGPYHFVGGYNPAAIAQVEATKLRKDLGMLAVAALIARCLPPSKDEGGGGRHDIALALCGYLLRNGEAEEDVTKMLVAAWAYRNASRDAVEDVRRSVRDTAARLSRDEPATGGRRLEELIPRMPAKIADFLGWERMDMREQRRHYMRTDLGNAERFVDTHRERVRWCPARKSFLVWDGKHWAWDEQGEAVKLAHATVRAFFHDAAHTDDQEEQKRIANFATVSQNTTRIRAMLTEAKPYLAIGMNELDRDPWLINCQNGILDLRKGKLRPHDPSALITKIAPVEYDPEAPCPRFEKFLKETLIDDAVISFVQRYAGYALTGTTRERVFAILYGTGKNGKTTLVELLHDALGDYATNTDTETLLMKRYQGVGNDVAALKGARFVSASEVEKGRRLAESKVKQLTGSDTVTARYLFGEPFDFRPEFKLWLSTNNKPVVQGTDDAIWDRIRLIPFTQRFEGEREDPKLADKLRNEMTGVFAWMVRGCLAWQEHGLGEPEKVAQATAKYRTEMDTLASFLDEECVRRPSAKVLAERLYEQYSIWSDRSGEHKEPKKSFVARLEDRGYRRQRETAGVNKGRYIWLGLGLRMDGDPPEAPDLGSPSEPKGGHGSPQESGVDKPNTFGSAASGESSEPKNQNLRDVQAREKEAFDSGFTGFTRFTPGQETRLTQEEVQRVKQLKLEGMDAARARESVLAKRDTIPDDDPIWYR